MLNVPKLMLNSVYYVMPKTKNDKYMAYSKACRFLSNQTCAVPCYGAYIESSDFGDKFQFKG